MKWLVRYASLILALLTRSGHSRHSADESESSTTKNSSARSGMLEHDQWDFYFCDVDDSPASIFLNLRFRGEGRIASADSLYRCHINMLEPGEHGLGLGSDADVLQVLEDEIAERAQVAGLCFVGRMRNQGQWRLFFYGSDGLAASLQDVTDAIIPVSSGRSPVIDSKSDPEWSCYFEFLCPDAERWQWITDRRVVESLQSHGDPLTKPRRVDHWACFGNSYNREEFINAVADQGFELEDAADDSPGERPFSAQVFRTDFVELESIHEVVMLLVRTANELGGEYDGWETFVERQ